MISTDIERPITRPFHREYASLGDLEDWRLISSTSLIILKTQDEFAAQKWSRKQTAAAEKTTLIN